MDGLLSYCDFSPITIITINLITGSNTITTTPTTIAVIFVFSDIMNVRGRKSGILSCQEVPVVSST